MTTNTCLPLEQTSEQDKKKKRGFTLTEIAIVLGIIGLILGAIWVAAAAVYNNLRISKATTELLSIAQAVRSMYATSTTVDPAANMTFGTAGAGAATTYAQAGIFPADMVASSTVTKGKVTTTNYQVLDPWGAGAAVYAAQTNVANDSFIVAFDGVTTPACITILTSNTGSGRDPGLVQVLTGPGGTAGTPGTLPTNVVPGGLPVLASNAQTSCATAPVSVGFQFLLRS